MIANREYTTFTNGATINYNGFIFDVINYRNTEGTLCVELRHQGKRITDVEGVSLTICDDDHEYALNEEIIKLKLMSKGL